MTDNDVLAWSVKDNLILITTDNDFEEMAWRENLPHGGILRLENLPIVERNALLKDVAKATRRGFGGRCDSHCNFEQVQSSQEKAINKTSCPPHPPDPGRMYSWALRLMP